MAKRRADGEGTLYQTKDGRWRGEVSLGYKADGKPRRKIIYGDLRGDVLKRLKEITRQHGAGIDVASGGQTLGRFLQEWLENTVRLKNRPQTYRSYEWIVRTHLQPGLGSISLEKLTPQKVQAFLNERHKQGLSATTVKHVNAALRAALSQAQRWQLVSQNAAKLVTLPRATRYKVTILDAGQAQAFLKATADTRNEALYSVALSLGLRRGEAIGLRWCDVDLIRGTLRVDHSLERIKGKGVLLSDPKSDRAKRTLRMPQVCISALLRQRERQETDRQWAGSGGRKAVSFSPPEWGRHYSPRWSLGMLDRHCKPLVFLPFDFMICVIPVHHCCWRKEFTQS